MSLRATDLFAGAGGFSHGARLPGLRVLWAANHWPTAVRWHSANHPHTQHACQDLQQADFRDVPAHDVLLASPAVLSPAMVSRGLWLPTFAPPWTSAIRTMP